MAEQVIDRLTLWAAVGARVLLALTGLVVALTDRLVVLETAWVVCCATIDLALLCLEFPRRRSVDSDRVVVATRIIFLLLVVPGVVVGLIGAASDFAIIYGMLSFLAWLTSWLVI
jgi:hypothetical protein